MPPGRPTTVGTGALPASPARRPIGTANAARVVGARWAPVGDDRLEIFRQSEIIGQTTADGAGGKRQPARFERFARPQVARKRTGDANFGRHLTIVVAACLALLGGETGVADTGIYKLTAPGAEGGSCLDSILRRRRTVREFASRPLTREQIGAMLWAAQGITSARGYRTAPSAGALYPLELRLVAGNVEDLPAGSYRYDPARGSLRAEVRGDLRGAVAEVALNQGWIAEASAVVVVSAVEARTTAKYGRRGIRYVHMEVGHASQNLLLQAVALGLAGATVGAFDDERLQQLLGLPEQERPLVLLPVGHAR